MKSLKSVLESVEALERDLVRAATATVVCESEDADIFSSWGAKRLILAGNGTVKRQRGHLADVLPLPLLPELRFALFVGSGHPPNIEGFFDFLAPMLPRLRPLERIVIVGTMCDGINARIAKSGLHHYREGRLVSLGFVDNNMLDALIANAHALLLPIGYGGGSNLKTAEALERAGPSLRPVSRSEDSTNSAAFLPSPSRIHLRRSRRQFVMHCRNRGRRSTAPTSRGACCGNRRLLRWSRSYSRSARDAVPRGNRA